MMTSAERARVRRIATHPSTDVYALARLLRSHGVAVRFAHASKSSFNTGDIVGVAFEEDGAGCEAAVITPHFLGLTGAVSPLPEEAALALATAAEDEAGGRALAAHLARLHEAVLGALDAGVTGNTLGAATASDFSDATSYMLLARCGSEQDLSPAARLRAWPVLRRVSCRAEDVCWAVGTVLRPLGLATPLRLTALTGGAIPLHDEVLCRLGGGNAHLGQSALLGDRGLARARAVRFTLGPVDNAWLERCAPLQAQVAHEVGAMLQATLPLHVRAHVALRLHDGAQRPWRIGEAPAGKGCPMENSFHLYGLGLQTFLGASAASGASVHWPPPSEQAQNNMLSNGIKL